MLEDEIRAIVRDEFAQLSKTKPREDGWLSTAQVAKLTGLSVSFFEVGRSLGAADRPPFKRVGRRVVYRREAVRNWMESRK